MQTLPLCETETLNIRLNELVQNIHTPSQLQPLMDAYAHSLNPYHCHQLATILPILQQRIKKTAALYRKVATFRRQAWGRPSN